MTLSLDDVHKWREAAIANGWAARPTYENHETVEEACTLEKDGWVAMLLSRPAAEVPWKPGTMRPPQTSISIWGPDKLSVERVVPFDMAQIEKNARKCAACGAEDVDTRRVAFCNRVCLDCLPSERKRLETPGWCD